MSNGTAIVFKMRIANATIEVECNYDYLIRFYRDYVVHSGKPDLAVKISMDEIIAERREVPRSERDIPGVAFRYADEFSEPFVLHQKIAEGLIQFDAFLFHGAVIAQDNCGYIFTAPSGVGKSTRDKTWLDEYSGSFIVNGDKPLIKVTESEILACGTPWCGEEGWNTNTMVPLRAVFLLERADEGEKSTIQEVSLAKAFPFLLQQTYRPADPDLMRKTIQLLKALEGKVKFYSFRSAPTPEAIRLAYETARPR